MLMELPALRGPGEGVMEGPGEVVMGAPGVGATEGPALSETVINQPGQRQVSQGKADRPTVVMCRLSA